MARLDRTLYHIIITTTNPTGLGYTYLPTTTTTTTITVPPPLYSQTFPLTNTNTFVYSNIYDIGKIII